MLPYLHLAWVLIALFEILVVKNPLGPSRILGFVFYILALVTIPAWEVSKFSSGSGITTYLDFGTGDEFQICLVVASIGFQLASLSSSSIWGHYRINLRESAKSLERFSFAGSFGLLLLWAIGQGPSLFSRNTYLQTDGFLAVLRPLAFAAPLAAALLFLVSVLYSKSRRTSAYVLGISWFIVLIAVGSRSALLFLIILVAVVMKILIKNFGKAFGLAGQIFFPPLAFYFLLLSFSATLWARANPHGLSRITILFNNPSSPSLLDLTSWWDTLSALLISFASIYPIVTLSVLKPAPMGLILENSSPLPTEFLGLSPNNSAEFLLPWLPKALLGEFLGLFGVLGLLLIVFAMALAAEFFYLKATKNNQMTLAAVIGASLIAAFLLSLQYPSRVTMRIYSLTYLAPLAVLAIKSFVRNRRRRF